MEALWGLAAWWHEQQLTKQTFWTAGILDEIEGDILEARDIAFLMGYLDEDVSMGDEEKAGAVGQERLPPGPPPPPPRSTPLSQLLPPGKEEKQLPLGQIEMRGNQQKAKRGGNILVLVDKVSGCGDGAKEEEGRVAFWDKKDGVKHQWWNELVLAQPLVESLQQQQKQPQLPGAAAPTPWLSPQAPLPPQ